MRRTLMLVGCLVLTAWPLRAEQGGDPEAERSVRRRLQQGRRGRNGREYAPDACVLPAGADMLQGRAAIQNFWAQTAQQLGDAKLTTLDVLPLGRTAAREIGTFSFKSKGQNPQDIVGKYAVVWRKIGGQWLLATDIWNMNK